MIKWNLSTIMQSVVDRLDAEPFKLVKVIPHFLKILWGVSLPVQDFAHDSQWLSGAVGPGWIPRELFICQIGVILDDAGGLHTIDPARQITHCKFSSPYRRIECCGQIDIVGFITLAIVRAMAGLQQVPQFQVGFCTVVERS